MATCHSKSHSLHLGRQSEVTDVYSHCGCCVHNGGVSQDHEEDESGSDSHQDHDSDTCVVCQSLLAPVGMTWVVAVVLEPRDSTETSSQLGELLYLPNSLLITYPRGPPVPLA